MRHVSVVLAVSLLVMGCAQLGGNKGTSGGDQVSAAARIPEDLCQSVSGGIGNLDRWINHMSQINLCLSGVSECPTKDLVQKACDSRDALSGFHTSGGCTDAMIPPRPGLCSRL